MTDIVVAKHRIEYSVDTGAKGDNGKPIRRKEVVSPGTLLPSESLPDVKSLLKCGAVEAYTPPEVEIRAVKKPEAQKAKEPEAPKGKKAKTGAQEKTGDGNDLGL